MKKVIAFALSLMLALSLFAGCGKSGSSSTAEQANLEGSLEEILAKVYDGITEMPMTMEQELTEEVAYLKAKVAYLEKLRALRAQKSRSASEAPSSDCSQGRGTGSTTC